MRNCTTSLVFPLDHQRVVCPPETFYDPVSQLRLIDPPGGDAFDDGRWAGHHR
jgi:hypothetical protein